MGVSRPRPWAVWRMVTKGTTATRARVSARVRMVRDVSSFIDETGEIRLIPDFRDRVLGRKSPGEAREGEISQSP